jgi:hypothetical protein
MVRRIGEGLGTQKPPFGGGSGRGVARGPVRQLDGEGVFECFHPHLQMLDVTPLLLDEQVFNAVEPTVHVGNILTDILDIFLAGHAALHHLGQVFDSGDVCSSSYVLKHSRVVMGIDMPLSRNILHN